MEVYGGIDLHGNNSVLALIDAEGKTLYRKRLANEWPRIERALEPYRRRVKGIVVESTFNWYWLVDALQAARYRVHLAHPTAIEPYSGLKHGDDDSDARWLAEMLRLGILPEGYIYPKEQRAVRDLLRKRSQLVRHRTAHILSIQNLVRRSHGGRVTGATIKRWDPQELAELELPDDVMRAIEANLRVGQCVDAEIKSLEQLVIGRTKLDPTFQLLKTVPGIGNTLALTIMLEVGDIARFKSVGRFASYCRRVSSQRLSNGKKKGSGNAKNGNKYLSWAFIEAANFAIRFCPEARRYYERKQLKSHRMVALGAVAHKLARASYFMMRDQVPFAASKAFGT